MMSNDANRPEEEGTPPEPSPTPEPVEHDPREELRRGIEKTRLPADVKAQILAQMPPPEEVERMYQELRENGGLSFEEFCASLGIDPEGP